MEEPQSAERETMRSRLLDADKFISRSMVLANAGGTIAVLSFIGGSLKDAPDEGFGLHLLFVLIGYLIGMLFGWFAVAMQWERYRGILYHQFNEDIGEISPPGEPRQAMITEIIFSVISTTLFLVSTIGAVWHLALLA